MKNLYGIYRGIVKLNSNGENAKPSDSELKGRCKIWIPGIYPKEYENDASKLPWAEPAYTIFGLNSSNGGINSVPAVGTVVWIFFEEGFYLNPIYFLSCQGGDGWSSQHVKQHTIKTENVSIIFDDSPSDGTKKASLTIDITNNNSDALEINITGKVKMNITGDVMEQVTGNVTTLANGQVSITGAPVIINGVPQVGS